ncbi:MAG: biotin--[acetyl-CoA-carboxylase] ligase [Candidatus Nitrospinota bacterium M3_3B_026]
MFDERIYHAARETRTLGANLKILDETSSTNTWLKQRAAEPGIEKLAVAAERQTAGRGRRGRAWISPPGVSLAASLAWPAPEGLSRPGIISLAVGLAAREAVEEAAEIPAALKYPNDLLLNGKKAAGLLVEMRQGAGRAVAVIGAGMNVNTAPEDFPEDLRAWATSLYIETGRKVRRELLLAFFVNALERLLDRLSSEGPAAVAREYRDACGIIGRRVAVAGNSGMEGVAVDINETGELVIETDGGARLSGAFGETMFV